MSIHVDSTTSGWLLVMLNCHYYSEELTQMQQDTLKIKGTVEESILDTMKNNMLENLSTSSAWGVGWEYILYMVRFPNNHSVLR